MRHDLDAALVRDFPALYRDRRGDTSATRMCDGFPGDGWEALLRRMSEVLEPSSAATGVRAWQVKEKLGGLRVYLTEGAQPPEVRAAVEAAESESLRTCEACGAPGRPRRLAGVSTLCDECATFAAEYQEHRWDPEWRARRGAEAGRRLTLEEAFRRWRRTPDGPR
ncbi:MAG: hypothetical protein FJ104_17020 [Deltaproteobacteria bacterium]|nr:hypothetical protein [Deltaproteobacteria bacterium]